MDSKGESLMSVGEPGVDLKSMAEKLLSQFADVGSCVIAFSGGVDSAVVAKAAQLVWGDSAIAVTGVSASLATGELQTARRVAESIGIRHEIVHTNELQDAGYLENEPRRCWHCKTELYTQLEALRQEFGFQSIVNGTNADDLGDFRPGLQAAEQLYVRSPLAECGFDKAAVRTLAHFWNLEVWDKPASPCLSSRVVYGLNITPERLARIDAAEALLRELGIDNLRVRCHHDELARIEVPPEEISRLCDPTVREELATRLRELGFNYITIDLEGFRSGNFTQLVPSEQLQNYSDTRGQQ